MKNSINKKGFTLVELIIVITILAILATIAFISFQGYSAEARDSKVKAEIGNMRNVVEAEMSRNPSILLSYASDYTSSLSNLNLAGSGTAISTGTSYKAGKINTTLLGSNTSNTYVFGASTKLGGIYQIAGKLTAGGNTTYLIGNYINRDTTGSGAGFFKLGDYVTNGSTLTGEIVKISDDKSKVTIGTTETGATNVRLVVKESDGLIAATGGTTTAITNGSATNLPF